MMASIKLTAILAGFISLIFVLPVFAQHEHMMTGMYGQYPMTREASGTSWQPDSTPLQGLNFMHKEWMLMMDAHVDAIYDKQNGKRGDEKTFSTSMFMFMAQHPFSNGTFGFRSMLSLDPLMGRDGYPLLLQTGETADGATTLIDRQHPHDLFMELAVTYSKPVSEEGSVFAYFGLPGEPALGAPAFMHRFSGLDIPNAPITHHWLDSTHITYGVGTLGFIWKDFKIEGSVFNGREPDENRWDIESPRFNSGSARISFNPVANWALQASFGYISSPEQLEPDVDIRRTTASVSYNKPFPNANWQTTFAWGRNDFIPGKTLDGFLLESTLRIKDTHSLFTRLERVGKDELFTENDPLYGEKFIVNKVTLGYIYDLPAYKHMKWGIGSSLDINIIPDKIKTSYGNNPLGYMVFIRFRLD
ncbi:MAG: hypothetical protein WC417_02040 [Candidatus Omnitrophota bacterium]|jgi:hypothetical protein